MNLFSILTSFLLLLSIPYGYSEWDPDYLISRSLLDGKHRDALERPSFHDLKTFILGYLKDSWCSQEKITLLMDLVFLERPAICVEIGVFQGASLLPVAATLKYLREDGEVYAIDPWSNQEAIRWMIEENFHKAWWASVDLESVNRSFQHMLEETEVEAFCTIIRKPAEQATDRFKSIDFLHLDGSLGREAALMDVLLYVPKVKKGGYILVSNILYTIDEYQPRLDAFVAALDFCEIVCGIDSSNSVLLRKT